MSEKLSILIPNFNKGNYLKQCLQSVLEQTSSEWEVYVVDDKSMDNSKEVLESFLDHPKIHVIHNSENLGCARSLHNLIESSVNDLVCFLGSDDGLVPTCVEEVLKFYKAHPEAQFVYTNFHVCDSKLRKQHLGWSRALPQDQTSLEVDCISALQTFRKSIYARAVSLDFNLKAAVDKDLILKLEEVTKPYHLAKPLYLYRALPNSLSRGKNFKLALACYEEAKKNARLRRQSKKIELTVALPLFRSKHIGWLALESLVRQKDINFNWELLVAEEEELAFGEHRLEGYREQLKKVHCVRIVYHSLKRWEALSKKWHLLAKSASVSSLCFLLQAADCYSQPYRLRETYDLFKAHNPDWVQTQIGPFYDIMTKKTVLYKGHGNTGLNMASSTSLIKLLPLHDQRFSVDSWLFKTLTLKNKTKLKVILNKSANWSKGFDSNGLNNISSTRGKIIKKCQYPFEPYKGSLAENTPKEILLRLDRCKSLVKENKFISEKYQEERMFITTNIHQKHITFLWEHHLAHMHRKNLTIAYPEDVLQTPRHLANFMCGIIMSEHFAWNDMPVEFDELTQKELDCVNDHIRLNHYSNPYGMVKTKTPIKVSARRIVEPTEIRTGGPILCANGMGKDGLVLALLVKELGLPVKSFTVGNQYIAVPRGEEVWAERKRAMAKFYEQNSIPSTYIKTDFVRNGYKIIPWWVFALPLAVHYKTDTILTALGIADTKVWLKNNTPIRPNSSIFHFDSISKATGLTLNSPFWGLSHYGMQKFFIERYPESVKFQRSCMLGFPNCGNCGKCYGLNSIFQALGENPRSWGMPRMKIGSQNPMNFNPMIKDVIVNTDKKVKGQAYDSWVEQLNTHAQEASWNSKAVGVILKKHFKTYSKDPKTLDSKCTSVPSKWKNWMGKGYAKFWGQ